MHYLDMNKLDIEDIEKELSKKIDSNTSTSRQMTNKRTPKSSKWSGAKRSASEKFDDLDSPPGSAKAFPGGSAFSFEDFGDDSVSNGNGHVSTQRPPCILDTLFREDPVITVFTIAKEVLAVHIEQKKDEGLLDQKEAIQYSKALRNITSKMDISSLHLSDGMTQFLAQGVIGSHSETAHGSSGKNLAALKTNVSAALMGFTSAGVAHVQKEQIEAKEAHDAHENSALAKKLKSMPTLYALHHPSGSSSSGRMGGSGGDYASAYGKKMSAPSSSHTMHHGHGSHHHGKRAHSPPSVQLPQLMSQSLSSQALQGLLAPQHSLFSVTTKHSSMGGGGSSASRNHHGHHGHSKKSKSTVLRQSDPANPLGVNHNASSSDLTIALMSSLRTMQKHSTMIKDSIQSAQSVINISDPKAKEVVFAVAADSIRDALIPFITYELRRGFTAWCFVVRQQRRHEKAGVFIRFLTLRNIMLKFNDVCRRILNNAVLRWRDFTYFEVQRIRRERALKAILKIQANYRKKAAQRKVVLLRQRRKYQKLYDSTIKIQALFRGKLQRWRYLKETRDKIQGAAAVQIQRRLRGFFARKRVYIMRMRRNKALAATTIQKIVRGRLATKRVQIMLRNRRHGKAATRIQCFVRGYIGRKHMARVLIEMAHYKYAVRIQAMVRGALARIHLHRKVAAMQEYRYTRNRAATKIQSAYRGYRCSVLYKMMMYKVNKTKKEEAKASTQITRVVRGFLAKCYLRDMKRAQREQWIEDARQYKETWAEDSASWFYYNEATGEALWEPSAMGYTKSDGLLVLASGEIIEDPLKVVKPVRGEGDEDAEDDDDEEMARAAKEKANKDKKKNSRLCSECNDRTAIRACHECGDKFCTKCYKYLHATGTRRNHTYMALGPLDCTECELRLAERWCVTCDESFCDPCWRKVHSKGKRVFHPYSEVSPEGRVDARIFTMDGDQLSDYDTSYAQQRADVTANNSKQEKNQQTLALLASNNAANNGYYSSADENTVALYGEAGYGGGEVAEYNQPNWEQYTDENGYPYWYDTVSGASQYENPYEGY